MGGSFTTIVAERSRSKVAWQTWQIEAHRPDRLQESLAAPADGCRGRMQRPRPADVNAGCFDQEATVDGQLCLDLPFHGS
jgi:hypothetical protein